MRAKTKVRKRLIREMLSADDAALTAHSEEAFQRLMSSFAHAGRKFGLTISLKKNNKLGQCSAYPRVQIHDYILEVVEEFLYLGITISSNLCLDRELDERIDKAAKAMARLTKRTTTFIKPACSALCFLAVKMGPFIPAKSVDVPHALPSKDPEHQLARPHPQ